MDEYGVTEYRAVATSASREARNREAFVREIKQKSGIALEVISTARRIAPRPRSRRRRCWAPKRRRAASSILAAAAWKSASCAITRSNKTRRSRVGTVRLMTTLNIPGRHPPVAGRASAQICARAARIEIAESAESRRQHCGRAGRQRRNSCGDRSRPARTRRADVAAFAAARTLARHS